MDKSWKTFRHQYRSDSWSGYTELGVLKRLLRLTTTHAVIIVPFKNDSRKTQIYTAHNVEKQMAMVTHNIVRIHFVCNLFKGTTTHDKLLFVDLEIF